MSRVWPHWSKLGRLTHPGCDLWGAEVTQKKEMGLADLIKNLEMQLKLRSLFFLPCMTRIIKRSFNTLRRVKTWLRSNMSKNHLIGLCMLSVTRMRIADSKNKFVVGVICSPRIKKYRWIEGGIGWLLPHLEHIAGYAYVCMYMSDMIPDCTGVGYTHTYVYIIFYKPLASHSRAKSLSV